MSTDSAIRSLAIFCKVVDNYGDIGICWRLTRQIRQEHGIDVTLWVDDLSSFRRICPEVVVDADVQQIAGVTVRHWANQDGVFAPEGVADLVIEFFAVDIPPGYIEAMSRCTPRPVWLNLEGLTAEEWVEGCHTLPSTHPRLPLTKHFFFPGFTDRTGGLLHEQALEVAREQFQSDRHAAEQFLAQHGVTASEAASFKVSLFCYPYAPVQALFDIWTNNAQPITCLVPEGVAHQSVQDFLQQDARPGAVRTQGALTVRVLPFIAQPDYDKLLWACDLNFVRGEDSWVRAQWAGRPFVWHIYPQDEDLHHVKLRAFLQKYAHDLPSVADFMLCWNGAQSGAVEQIDWANLWSALQHDLQKITDNAIDWQRQMLTNGDLASNLLKFANSVRSEAGKNSV